MITTRALTKRFGRTVALADVDLQVARGECLGLAGVNGGGRTTLLRILATLSRPSSGVVEIDRIDIVRHVYDLRSRLAYVGHELLEGHGLRVREYLECVRAARRTAARRTAASKPDGARSVDRVLERAQLPPDADVDGLSSGFRQRLALAAAFLIDAEVLLLDDPLRAIDSTARPLFVDWLREVRDQGTTMVVALNEERDLKALCHGVVRLDAGHVGSRSTLRELPRASVLESAGRGVPFTPLTVGGA